jgi:NarL family two-component system sensor histidine kinase LiaS
LRTSCTIYGEVKDISAEVESSLYRILQETLSNARQHAQCTELSVILAVRDNQWLSLEVRDNGRGFDVSQVGQRSSDKSKRGLGLISMRERVDSIGGELVIKSEEAQGTHISARLPLSPVVSNAPAE